MRLIHFAAEPMVEVWPVLQVSYGPDRFAPKPKGLWVSDEDDYGWRQWCSDENFGTDRLAVAHEIELATDARVLTIDSPAGIDQFTQWYGDPGGDPYWIDWPAVASVHQGIVISPYIAARRMARGSRWYYPWDCASGCIWDSEAIAGFSIVELAPLAGES